MSTAGATVSRLTQSPEKTAHRRNKSSQVLKAIMPSKSHKRIPSDGAPLATTSRTENVHSSHRVTRSQAVPLLPPDHPHSGQRVLGEIRNPSGSSAVKPRNETKEAGPKGFHKKTLSTVSLRSLGKDKDGDTGSKSSKESPKKPVKTKSITGLSAVFAKNRSQKDLREGTAGKDKENRTPPSSAVPAEQTPIWAQYRTTPYQEVTTTSSIPLNDRRSIEEEIARYTPKEYSPSKQRNFYGLQPPALQKRPSRDQRPQSVFLPASTSATSLLESISRKMSGERERPSPAKSPDARQTTLRSKIVLRRTSSERRAISEYQSKSGPTTRSKGSRVMEVVAAINGRSKDATVEEKLDPAIIAAEFEAVLDSRNIPESMRPKMRGLADNVKADFIKKNKVERSQNENQKPSKFAAVAETVSKRIPTRGRSGKPSEHVVEGDELAQEDSLHNSSKRSRPRSKTFTLSKGDSPTKKQKQDGWSSARSLKSVDLPKSPSTRSLSSVSSSKGTSVLNKTPKQPAPSEFVEYLRKVQKPQDVEVGKVHKLRLLLRNETVAWVDSFIEQGGMTEAVNLLHRIMEIEWREEHEDTLLHEVLLCLKGLCTTDSALRKLREIESTFFPTLLKMLFDEEHKGPSEFTTRGLIISLLFVHLSAARNGDLPSRARTVLNYMKDPVPEEDRRPLAFILEMHQPRPYRVWCREITNVTKEVFWIFLHHLNIIPLPDSATTKNVDTPYVGTQESPPSSRPTSSSSCPLPHKFAKAHFPQPRPPVPAAPYVGGVEWDATNYLSTHLDLLNGLIASLPTSAERNVLREELRASGFEKVMGGALRTCKEKFYGSVHDGLKTWVRAALEDGWEVKTVRMGLQDGASSPVKSQARGAASPKKKNEPAPKLELPQLGLGGRERRSMEIQDEWIGV